MVGIHKKVVPSVFTGKKNFNNSHNILVPEDLLQVYSILQKQKSMAMTGLQWHVEQKMQLGATDGDRDDYSSGFSSHDMSVFSSNIQ